ncbi:hypothetical protein E3Q24_01429 [Wallemia mellicola]|nr:hypothetical protein E3Q24_01429 [Wallemia mellicola]TIC24338.1 hypothetical protein E3Q12_01547 [Wallemia mellicola]
MLVDTSIPIIEESNEEQDMSPALASTRGSFETFRGDNEDKKTRSLRMTLDWLAPNNTRKLKQTEAELSNHRRMTSSGSTYSSSATDFTMPCDNSEVASISSASLFTSDTSYSRAYTPPNVFENSYRSKMQQTPPPVPTNSRPPATPTLYTKEGLPIDLAQLMQLLGTQNQQYQQFQPQPQYQQTQQFGHPQVVYQQAPSPQYAYTDVKPLHKPVSTPLFRERNLPHMVSSSDISKPKKEKVKTFGRGGAARKSGK